MSGRPDVLTAVRKIEDLVDSKKVSLATSVIVDVELSQSKLTEEERDQVSALFNRPNVDRMDVTSRITRVASEINEHYRPLGITLQTPDIIHLASAVHCDADIMHTTDGSGKNRCGKLLGLAEEGDGLCGGKHKLKIEIPSSAQLHMFTKQDIFPDTK